jgi:hypothetical protein
MGAPHNWCAKIRKILVMMAAKTQWMFFIEVNSK